MRKIADSTHLYQQYPANASPAIPATLQPITITKRRTFEEFKTLSEISFYDVLHHRQSGRHCL